MTGIARISVYNVSVPDRIFRDVRDGFVFQTVAVAVRHWRPIRCPDCGSTGPFRALANWVPVLIDGDGEVIEELGEDIWAVLDETGPGLWCRQCDSTEFYPRATMYPDVWRP